MNSIAGGSRSHKGGIRLKGNVSGQDVIIKCDDQAAQRRVTDRLVPMIDDGSEWLFAFEDRHRHAQHNGHHEQERQDPIEPDGAERREDDENSQPQPEADDDPDDLRLARQIGVRRLNHAGCSLRKIVAAERHVKCFVGARSVGSAVVCRG
jgi:hypothetical protein